tara:strand:- start:123 stop:347 length:225 start_codon:yes stop_codon:yes gene_type:complete
MIHQPKAISSRYPSVKESLIHQLGKIEVFPFATQNATQVANIATLNFGFLEKCLLSTYYGEPCWVRTSDLLIKS